MEEETKQKIYKLQGMGNEEYVRVDGYCPCKSDNETCNFCKFIPKDMLNHIHKFIYIKTLIKSNLFRYLFNCELRTKMYRCACGEIRQEGHYIKKLPQFWDETFI